jgi:hypothetical protein
LWPKEDRIAISENKKDAALTSTTSKYALVYYATQPNNEGKIIIKQNIQTKKNKNFYLKSICFAKL